MKQTSSFIDAIDVIYFKNWQIILKLISNLASIVQNSGQKTYPPPRVHNLLYVKQAVKFQNGYPEKKL